MSGLFAILARRHKDKWYVAGLNGEPDQDIDDTIAYVCRERGGLLYGCSFCQRGSPATLEPIKKTVKVDKNGNAKVSLQALGGLIITDATD